MTKVHGALPIKFLVLSTFSPLYRCLRTWRRLRTLKSKDFSNKRPAVHRAEGHGGPGEASKASKATSWPSTCNHIISSYVDFSYVVMFSQKLLPQDIKASIDHSTIVMLSEERCHLRRLFAFHHGEV